jgi:hypothetical protein
VLSRSNIDGRGWYYKERLPGVAPLVMALTDAGAALFPPSGGAIRRERLPIFDPIKS